MNQLVCQLVCQETSLHETSASVRQADVPTNFNPIDPDKKSASVRQPLST